MAVSLATARKAARDAGVPMAALRGLTTAEEIQAVIDGRSGKASKGRVVAKKKTVAKKATATRTAARKPARKAAAKTTARTTRTNSRTTTKAAPKTTARKTTATKTTKRNSTSANGNGGRNLLDGIDWKLTEGWNPREGSAPDVILRTLRKFRGDRDKTFEALKADVWDFVKKTDSNGRKRSKAEAEWQLRYRISRTAWDFAKRTGQHEASTNRAEYGTGGTGIGVSGGMPVQFRPDDFDGKPVYKRGKAKTATKATASKATGGRRTAAKSTTKAKPRTTAKARTTAQKRSTGTTRRARPTVRRK